MKYIPPLLIEGVAGDKPYNLLIRRSVIIDSYFKELYFTMEINNRYIGTIKWDKQWFVDFEELQSEDIELIIPKLQQHIKEHHRTLYFSLGLPANVNEVHYTTDMIPLH